MLSLTGQFFHELIISTTLKDDTKVRVPTCLEFCMNMKNASCHYFGKIDHMKKHYRKWFVDKKNSHGGPQLKACSVENT